jgi:hypothetical protein
MSEPNIPLLRKYVEWVEEQAQLPELHREWHQGWWIVDVEERNRYREATNSSRGQFRDPNVCGTAYCVAGKVVTDAGYKPVYSFTFGTGNIGEVADGEETYGISELASELLGVTYEDGNRLFASHNTAQDIRKVAEEIAGERL